MRDGLTIGELAGACGVSRDALRYYERERLLPPVPRTASGYRQYGAEAAARVRFIRRAQSMGMTLGDVRELLRVQRLRSSEQCRRVAARLRQRVEAIDTKIAELREFRGELEDALRQCERAGADTDCCPVVVDLARNGKET